MAKSGAAMYDSMLQGLQQILSELGAMMAAPDADIRFLSALQQAIVQKIKQGTQQAIAAQGGPGGGGPGGPGPNQIAPGGGAGMGGLVNQGALQSMGAMGGMGGGPGGMLGGGGPPGAPPMTNADELRRMAGAGAVG